MLEDVLIFDQKFLFSLEIWVDVIWNCFNIYGSYCSNSHLKRNNKNISKISWYRTNRHYHSQR